MRSAKVHRKPIQRIRRSLHVRTLGSIVLIGIGFILAPVAFGDSEPSPQSAPDAESPPADPGDPTESQWRPELGLGFLLHVQGLDGSATSNFMGTDLRSVSDKAISPGFRLTAGMSSPVLAQAGGLKPRLFFQTGIQYLLEDSFTAYRGKVTDTVGYSLPHASPNCDVPAFGHNVKGLVGTGTPVTFPPGSGEGDYHQNFAVGPAGQYYQDIETLLPDLFTPDPNNPSLDHGYDQERVVSLRRAGQQVIVGTDRVPGAGGFGVGGTDCDTNFRAKTSIDLMWELGVGVEFTLPVLSRQFHVRLSVNYRGQSFGETEGTWDRASSFEVCMAPPKVGAVGGATSNGGCLTPGDPVHTYPRQNVGNITEFALAAEHKKYSAPRFTASGTGSAFVTHAIGPTVQVDVDVFKRGDLRINLFLELGFAWLINDAGSTLSFEVPDQIYNCTIDTSSALCAYKRAGEKPSVSFAVAPQTLISQGGGGVRILWSPPW